MPDSNKRWEAHPVIGVLCRKFRESQRRLVRSNIEAVEKWRDTVGRVIAAEKATSSSKRRKFGGHRRANLGPGM